MFTATGVHIETGLHFTSLLEKDGISVLRLTAFQADNFQAAELSAVRRSGIRVVVLVAGSGDTRAVGNTGITHEGGWAWLTFERRKAVRGMLGWLFIQSIRPSKGMDAFAKQVSIFTKSHFNLDLSPDSVDITYSVALFEAIMLYAHAATKVMSDGGDLQDGEAVTAAVRNVSFTGVGGSVVTLDSKGDRVESYELMNYVLEEGNVMRSVAVGGYTQQQYSAHERSVVWPGGRTEVPADYISGIPDVHCTITSAFIVSLCTFISLCKISRDGPIEGN